MASVGGTITATDYNTVQSRINTIMGTDYGQTLLSSQVAVGDTITDDQFDNLRTDITKAYTHQQGSGPTITNVAAGDTIEATTINEYATLMTTVETNKFVIAPTQGSVEAGTTSSRTTAWNGTITHTVTLTFASAARRTQFFNAGGEIRFSASRTGGTANSINTDWSNMLSNMGQIKMNYTETTSTGSGTGTSIGMFDLTSTYQQIFQKAGSGVYAANDYIVRARATNTTTVQFEIRFQDDKGANPQYDENVTGTTQSVVQHFRATGSNVSTPAPTYTNNSNL